LKYRKRNKIIFIIKNMLWAWQRISKDASKAKKFMMGKEDRCKERERGRERKTERHTREKETESYRE
jgi:hypothetical protein